MKACICVLDARRPPKRCCWLLRGYTDRRRAEASDVAGGLGYNCATTIFQELSSTTKVDRITLAPSAIHLLLP